MEHVTVILPAFNEEKIIGEVISSIKKVNDTWDILVIDDASSDNTAEIAASQGATVISHPYNKGNGAAIKTGIRNAANEILILMDADGQHTPDDIPQLLDAMKNHDMIVGARKKGSEGSLHRNLANWFYNIFATYLCGQKIFDLTSGFRVVRKSVIKKFLYLFPNTFSYPTTSTLSLIRAGYSVSYVPIHVKKRIGKSKIRIFKDGVRFFIIMFRITMLFKPIKVFFPASILLFLTGCSYYLYTFITQHRFTNMSLLLFISSANIFLLGLIAEQIAQLRYDRSEIE